VPEKQTQLAELEQKVSDPDIWKDRVKAEALLKEAGEIRHLIERYTIILNAAENANEETIYEAERNFKKFELEQLLKGKYDSSSAVLSIFAGAGGQDAEDWAGMLYDMYTKYIEQRGWKMRVISERAGDVNGNTGSRTVKDISLEVRGTYAYGYLKGEQGVHR